MRNSRRTSGFEGNNTCYRRLEVWTIFPCKGGEYRAQFGHILGRCEIDLQFGQYFLVTGGEEYPAQFGHILGRCEILSPGGQLVDGEKKQQLAVRDLDLH